MATITTTNSSGGSRSTQSASASAISPTSQHDCAIPGSSGHAGNSSYISSWPEDNLLPTSVQPPIRRTGRISAWTEEMERDIIQPYEYLASQPGKDIRKQLLAACNVWLQIDETALSTIGRCISKLHNASLLARKGRKLMRERVDDIQDNSSLRRGQPAAHTVYGIAQTINSANHAYFLAQRELLQLGEASTMVKIFNEELVNLHRGQGMDIYWRDTMKTPTEDEYLLMISNKTGGLFRLAMRLMQAVSKRGVDLVPLADLLGLVFQIQDDYLNLTSQSVSTTIFICRAEADVHEMTSLKGFCDDLEEGKFSFPVIHAIRNDPSETEWMLNTLIKKPRDEATKSQVVDYMTCVTHSMEYTRVTVEGLMAQMRASLLELGPANPAFEALLAKLIA
ncbi:MAG: hypothetical protein LQ337_002846 [Flavoplaca oasis]|nr:MAG: hypothetical protein LQ337_002846 [Flavoplaca oasis]